MGRILNRSLAVIAWLAAACPVMGQAAVKKALKEEDHHLWSTLEPEALSESGRWASYTSHYGGGKDTLFVQSASETRRFAFPKGRSGQFRGDAYFGCLTAEGFQMLDLKTGTVWEEASATKFEFVSEGIVLLHRRDGDGKATLLLRDSKGGTIRNRANVDDFSISRNRDAMVYSQAGDDFSGAYLVLFARPEASKLLASAKDSEFHTMVWQHSGKSVAFGSRKKESTPGSASMLWHYDLKQKKLRHCELLQETDWPKGLIAFPVNSANMMLSDDGQRVYFAAKSIAKKEEQSDPKAVQVWNAADRRLPAYREKYGDPGRGYVVEWTVKTNRIALAGDTVQTAYHVNTQKRFSVLCDLSKYRDETKFSPDRDYYIQDLASGKKELLAQKLSMQETDLVFSAEGNAICYFKDGHWHAYSTATKKHLCISRDASVSFADEDNDRPEAPRTYGSAGWTKDGGTFLFYDKFDLWGYHHKTQKLERLTRGREANLSFRVAKFSRELEDDSWLARHGGIVDLEKGIVLEALAEDHSRSGFFTLQNGQQEKPAVLENRRITKIKKALKGTVYSYLEEDFDSPPSLQLIKSGEKKGRVLFASNPHHKDYLWGRSELVDYADSKGNQLKGVLFYPAGHDASKSYPMVVRIYERQHHSLHAYTNPSFYNASGFNKTLYAGNGYFVFCPDIRYEVGNPGFSAADCVMSGTKAALVKAASIDPGRIGLLGHSFGGYETNFIVTQTDMFRAAVSGSGISDLTSFYLSMGWNYGITDIWRFESEQFRMGKPLFENFNGYSANSPIRHAAAINTPLLSYTGDKDYQVSSFQSMEFFIALRRLKKEHIMFVYPDEEHVLHSKKNQKDLTVKMLQWFDYHLKDTAKPKWLQHDLSN